MTDPLNFFIENFPSPRAIILGGPPALLWAYTCLFFAGYLKKRRGVKTGYTRKIFHFLIFTSAAIIHFTWGLSGVFLFGAMTSLVIFYALFRGSGHLLYEAMAREKDAPHRTYYIIAPYLATLLGGLTSNFWFAEGAIIGYLVTGIGDAVAEPVGVRWGKHPYRVPSFNHVKSMRSVEGSAAVFFASAVMIILGIALNPHFNFSIAALWKVPLLAFICMIVEAVSPHGWDNASMQIIPAFLAMLLL